MRPEAIRRVRTWPEAYEILESLVEPGDTVLIKGRHQQRLARLALALEGQRVQCRATECNLKAMRCDYCDHLSTGWPGDPRVVP